MARKQYELSEEIYHRILAKCNHNCDKAPKISLNKALAIESPSFNKNLNLKREVVQAKMDYYFKMWRDTDYEMSPEVYENKFEWYMAHDMNIEFHRESDHKFRHSPTNFMSFRTRWPVIRKVLNKPEYRALKEYLFGSNNMDFDFSEDYLEAKEEFMMYHGLAIARTEKNKNCEFNNFLTTCENLFSFTLSHKDERLPLRDPFKL